MCGWQFIGEPLARHREDGRRRPMMQMHVLHGRMRAVHEKRPRIAVASRIAPEQYQMRLRQCLSRGCAKRWWRNVIPGPDEPMMNNGARQRINVPSAQERTDGVARAHPATVRNVVISMRIIGAWTG